MSALNLLLENLDPLAQLLLQALFRTLWQGVLIAALIWLLLRVFKQASATTRHAIWLAGLLIISALPLVAIATSRQVKSPTPPQAQTQRPMAGLMPLTLSAIPPVTYPQNSVELLVERPLPKSAEKLAEKQIPPRSFDDIDRLAAVEEARKVVTLSESASVAPAAIAKTTRQTATVKNSFWLRASNWFFDSRWPLALVAIWMIVSALMLGRLAQSYFSLLRLRRSMQPAEEMRQRRVEQLAAQFGISRFVLLFTSPKVTM
ncbi:MAG: hypothetical protein AAB401_17680, partial [Acidobacteriota bacterium]